MNLALLSLLFFFLSATSFASPQLEAFIGVYGPLGCTHHEYRDFIQITVDESENRLVLDKTYAFNPVRPPQNTIMVGKRWTYPINYDHGGINTTIEDNKFVFTLDRRQEQIVEELIIKTDQNQEILEHKITIQDNSNNSFQEMSCRWRKISTQTVDLDSEENFYFQIEFHYR